MIVSDNGSDGDSNNDDGDGNDYDGDGNNDGDGEKMEKRKKWPLPANWPIEFFDKTSDLHVKFRVLMHLQLQIC